MKPSGIGGQAVIEGIMMRNKDKYSIAVRKPDKDIEVVVKSGKMLTEKYKWLNYPIIRGVFNFVDSLVIGISTINYSASFYDDPAEQETTKVDEIGKSVFKDKFEAVLMAVTIILSVAFAVGLFMLLPYFSSRLLRNYIASKFLLNFIEGIIRVVIFIAYLLLISKMNDIKRTFMYHGAEHKCINCIENGIILTPENVQKCSRFHKRCGTSFLFFVMFVSIVFFIFIRVDNTALQLIIRVLLIPVIAGVSYELIRLAGKSDNKWVDMLSKPGMLMQRLTTKEPDIDMIEVAIQAVEAVFDWKAFIVEYYKDSENPLEELESKEEELKISADLLNNVKTTRTLDPEAIDSDKAANEMTSADMEYVDAENDILVNDALKSAYEESDDSESTAYDNVSHEADEKAESKVKDEKDEDELPEGFELLDDDDTYDNAIRTKNDIINRTQSGILDEENAPQKADMDNVAEAKSSTGNNDLEGEAGKATAETGEIVDKEADNSSDGGKEVMHTVDTELEGEDDDMSDLEDDGIEFEEPMEEDELTGDDLPLFKAHDTE